MDFFMESELATVMVHNGNSLIITHIEIKFDPHPNLNQNQMTLIPICSQKRLIAAVIGWLLR